MRRAEFDDDMHDYRLEHWSSASLPPSRGARLEAHRRRAQPVDLAHVGLGEASSQIERYPATGDDVVTSMQIGQSGWVAELEPLAVSRTFVPHVSRVVNH